MQTPESIALWAERQDDKKPQGRAGHLSPEQKQQIRLAYFEAGGNTTYIALGKQFNVNRETVAACMKGDEFEKLQKEYDEEIRAAAFTRLKAKRLAAADAWGVAIDEAADRGNHKPAQDLLLHTGVIQPIHDGSDRGISIVIGVKAEDVQISLAPGDTQTVLPGNV